MKITINKTNELTFSMPCNDFIAGSTFVFMAKRSRRDPDSEAVFTKSSADGILFEPTTGKGLIVISPADTQGESEGMLDCDLQMVAPTAIYVVGELKLSLILPVNLATVN